MYFNHRILAEDYLNDRISAQEVFYELSRLPHNERKKFINKNKKLLLIKK